MSLSCPSRVDGYLVPAAAIYHRSFDVISHFLSHQYDQSIQEAVSSYPEPANQAVSQRMTWPAAEHQDDKHEFRFQVSHLRFVPVGKRGLGFWMVSSKEMGLTETRTTAGKERKEG